MSRSRGTLQVACLQSAVRIKREAAMLIRRLRYWFDNGKRAAALREEMELHFEEKAAELRERGA
jgi:hypothetical protein